MILGYGQCTRDEIIEKINQHNTIIETIEDAFYNRRHVYSNSQGIMVPCAKARKDKLYMSASLFEEYAELINKDMLEKTLEEIRKLYIPVKKTQDRDCIIRKIRQNNGMFRKQKIIKAFIKVVSIVDTNCLDFINYYDQLYMEVQ